MYDPYIRIQVQLVSLDLSICMKNVLIMAYSWLTHAPRHAQMDEARDTV